MKYIHSIILSMLFPFLTHAMEVSDPEQIQHIEIRDHGPIDKTNYRQCMALMYRIANADCNLDGENLEFADCNNSKIIYVTPFNSVHLALKKLMKKNNGLNLIFVIQTLQSLPHTPLQDKQQKILTFLHKTRSTSKNLYKIQLDLFSAFYNDSQYQEPTHDDWPMSPEGLLVEALKEADTRKFDRAQKLGFSNYPSCTVQSRIDNLIKEWSQPK